MTETKINKKRFILCIIYGVVITTLLRISVLSLTHSKAASLIISFIVGFIMPSLFGVVEKVESPPQQENLYFEEHPPESMFNHFDSNDQAAVEERKRRTSRISQKLVFGDDK